MRGRVRRVAILIVHDTHTGNEKEPTTGADGWLALPQSPLLASIEALAILFGGGLPAGNGVMIAVEKRG